MQPGVRHQHVAPRVPFHATDGFPVVSGRPRLGRDVPRDVTHRPVAFDPGSLAHAHVPTPRLLRRPHVVRAEPARLTRAVPERRLRDNLRVSVHPAPSPGARRKQRTPVPHRDLRVTGRGSRGDARREGRQAAHGTRLRALVTAYERLRQEHQPAALAVDNPAARRERGDRRAKTSVPREFLRVHLGVPTAEQDALAPLRERVTGDGRERHKIRAVLAQ